VKNVGFGTGSEFRDSAYVLSAKNNRVLKENMVLVISVGLTDLVGKDGSKYALHLADTIKVENEKSVFLSEAIKSVKDQLFFLTSESDEEKEKAKKPAKKLPAIPRANGSPTKKTVAGKVLRNATRSAKDDAHQTASAKILEHQRELHIQLQESGLQRYSEVGDTSAGKEGKGWRKFQSYRGEAAVPPEAEKLRVSVSASL
jgi:nucleosome binding factor SPN SPT16 subunit